MDEGLVRIRHARSKKDFPFLKLEEDEFVEFSFKRAAVCLFLILGSIVACFVLILLAFLLILLGQNSLDEMGKNFVLIILGVIAVVALIAGWVAVLIYRGNRLIITNKHAIQTIMTSPMVKSINMIDLPSIEDASFSQSGLLQTMFNYGTFRLSTVGGETTYTFQYSDISPEELRAVSKLITALKDKKKAED